MGMQVVVRNRRGCGGHFVAMVVAVAASSAARATTTATTMRTASNRPKAKEEAEALTQEAKAAADAWEKEEGVALNKQILESIAQQKKKRCILRCYDEADPSQAEDEYYEERVRQLRTWLGQHKA